MCVGQCLAFDPLFKPWCRRALWGGRRDRQKYLTLPEPRRYEPSITPGVTAPKPANCDCRCYFHYNKTTHTKLLTENLNPLHSLPFSKGGGTQSRPPDPVGGGCSPIRLSSLGSVSPPKNYPTLAHWTHKHQLDSLDQPRKTLSTEPTALPSLFGGRGDAEPSARSGGGRL